MKSPQNHSARASALQITLSLALLSVSAILFASSFKAAPPAAPSGSQLGNYPDISIPLSADTTVTPDATPTNTTSINVSTDTNFKGTFVASPTTGVVTVTDAHPAGTYTVTVTGFGPGGTTAKTFTLTVSNGCTGTDSFTNAADVSGGSYLDSVAIGDFNGDGKQDLAVANGVSNTVSIRLGDGLGGFSGSTEVSVGFFPLSVAIGDFNGDGKQDLAVANANSDTVSIRLGDGLGGFSGSTEVSVGFQPWSVAIGDFNGDGKQDLAVANYTSSTVSIRLGNGLGGFSGSTDLFVGSFPTSVAIGDFNGDGNQDLAVANLYSNTVSIIPGDGSGGFGFSTDVTAGARPISVAIGDFNGDGNQDLAVTNYDSSTVSIRLGNGLGGFSGTNNVGVGTNPRPVAIGDFNGDGKQDLAVANQNSNTVSIRLGDGLGGFSGSTEVSVGSGPISVAIGDFNGDGKQDLAVANNLSNTISIRLGQCAAPTPKPTSTPSPITVSLPIDIFDNSVPSGTVIIEPVMTTLIDPITTGGFNYIGFQGDFTFDSAVVTFATPQTQEGGLTATNWSISANILNTGPGTIKTLRISAFSVDFTPLNGMGTLFNLRMLRVSNTPGDTSPLVWKPMPNNFVFFDDSLGQHAPQQTNGLITITGVQPTPSPTPTASPLPTPTATPTTTGTPMAITVSLPIDVFDNSVPSSTAIIEPVTTTLIDSTTTGGLNYVGFQGDFTFDSAVVGFATPQVERAGLTSSSNWNVSANILNTGPGTLKTLRISAISLDITPLNGMGTLFNLRMLRVSNIPGAMSPLVWKPAPDNFIFIDDNLGAHTPNETNGLITITGIPPTPSPTPTATATVPPTPTPPPPPITVLLPIDTMDTSIPASTILTRAVTTTLIDPTTTMGINYVGFQGDFTYDSAVVGFATPQVQGFGLTGSNWNVSSNILNTGPGTIKTLRISAFSLDFTPLDGMGVLFNLRMLRVSNTPGDMSPLIWKQPPDQFFFIDDNLGGHTPNQPPGLITITGALGGTPSPSPTSTPTATPTATATVPPTPTPTPAPITVFLPIANFDVSVPISTVFIEPVTTTLINPATTKGANYVGFQGDFTFDSAVVGFATPQVQGAGLTGTNWNVSSNILNTGPGTIKTLRISAFSLDFTPLNGMGTLFNLRMLRVGNTPGATSPLIWAQPPNNFIFIDDNLDEHTPNQPPGLITITQAGGNPTPTPTPTATATVAPTQTPQPTATPSPNPSPTPPPATPTPAPTATAAATATATATSTATATATATATVAPSATATATPIVTPAPTQTPQPTATPHVTPTPRPHVSPTPTPRPPHVTPTPRPPHVTPTPRPHVTPTPRPPHATPTPTPQVTATPHPPHATPTPVPR